MSCVVNGINWSQYEQQKGTSQQSKIGRGSWERIEKKIWNGVEKVTKAAVLEARQSLESKSCMIISGDCAWSHRRNAPAASYIMLEFTINKIIAYSILTKDYFRKERKLHEGNYFGPSKGMEFEGFSHCVNELEQLGILKKVLAFVADQDGQVKNAFAQQPRLQHITVLHDPGHYAKKLEGKVREAIWKSQSAILCIPDEFLIGGGAA